MQSLIYEQGRRRRAARVALTALAAACALTLTARPQPAPGASFGTAPHVPSLPTLTLNARAQTLNATMNNFSVSLGLLELAGFNVTVNGDASTGHSAVFKVYCPGPSTCGSDPVGYVSGSATLPAGSLTLNSTGASWTGGPALSVAPLMLCNSGCALDTASPVKVATQAVGLQNALAGTWSSTGWSTTSIAFSAPTTLRAPLQAGEVYHVDLLWTLGSGP